MADKEVRVKIIGDTSDLKKKLSDLKKELKDMASSLDKMDSGGLDKATKSIKDFQDAVENTDKEVDELNDSLDKLDSNGGFDKTTKGAKELDDTFERVTKSAKEFDDTLDKLDNNNFNTLNKNTQETQETFKSITDRVLPEFNRQLEKAQDTGKESNTIFDRLKNLFSNIDDIGGRFGGKLSASFDGCKNNILEMAEAFGSLSTVSSLNTKRIDELRNNIKKAENHIEDWRKKQEKLNKTIEETKEQMDRVSKSMDNAESQDEIEKLDKEYENLGKKLEGLERKFKSFNSSINREQKGIRDYKKELKELGATAEETVKGFDKMKQGLKDAFSSLGKGDFGGALDGLKDGLSGLFEGLPTWAKVGVVAITGITTALKKCYEQGVNQLKRGFETLGTVFSKIGSIARSFGSEVKNAFENITGLELDLSSLMEIPIEFEDAMVRAGAICGATGEDFEQLEQLARKLGATTRYSATDVANAMIEMGQQGYKLEEIMGSVESVLNLATVGNLDLARSAEIVTNTLNAYGLEADKAGHVADVLAVASTNSGTSVEQLGQALENCSATAGALGISVEDTATAIGLMGDNFIKSGKAGTSLNTFMANMSKPTKAMTDCMAKYNLEGGRQKILNGDLIGGYKEFAKKMEGLTNEQKAQIATTIAGKEGMTGFLAIVNSGTEGIEKLEKSIENANQVAEHMAKTFDATLKGSLLNLSSAIEERVLQVFDKIKEPLMNLIDDITRFFNIWNGFDDELKGGLASALEWLADKSKEWGEAIAEGLSNIISNIEKFVNGGALDSLLKVGTNIIDGIAKGIAEAKDNGSLDKAISGAIKKIGTWCSENLDTLIEVGKTILESIAKGINENQDLIGEIIQQVMEMQTEIDSTIAYEKGRLFGETFGKAIIEGLESILTNLGQYIQGFIESFDWGKTLTGWIEGIDLSNLGFGYGEDSGKGNSSGGKKKSNGGVWSWLSKLGFGDGSANEQGQKDGKDYTEGVGKGVKDNGENLSNTVNDNFKNTKPKTDQTANEIGQGISDGIMSKLETLDTQGLKDLQTELTNTQTTTQNVATGMSSSFTAIQNSARTSFVGLANIVRNQFLNISNIIRNQMLNCANIVRNQALNMSNIFRNQFVNMSNIARNQMVNVSNIIRNQATSWSNIIRNQVTNARNSLTQQMISMASVTRTQMVNCSNIIRNQATSWSNIIRNQAQNARNSLTSSFMSMANVVRNQMANCLSIVRSYMAQIKAQTSQTMTMKFKVEKSITTTNITKNVTQGMANTMASMNTNMRNVGRPSIMTNTGLSSGGIIDMSGGINGNLALEVPLYLDGREIARASASYNQAELSKLEKRSKRRRGE